MSIEEDAHAFGQHFEVGWQLGLLVARSVHKRTQAGRPSKSEPVRNKVSCAQFARLAGVSDRTVQLVYDTWQLAAEEGHCTPADQLLPEMTDPKLLGIDVDDREHREMWRKFYRQVRERRAKSSKTRTSAGQRNGRASSSRSNAEESAGTPASESPSAESSSSQRDGAGHESGSDPTAHPLYGLLLAINDLGEQIKRDRPAASIIDAAKKVASRQHRAALVRITGAM